MKKILIYTFLFLQFVCYTNAQQLIIEPPISRPRPNPPQAGMFEMELHKYQIHTKITGQSATTSLDQIFYNPSSNQLQGYFIYPIPKDASIDNFTMYINGKETQGEILDAKKARKIYEDIVRRSLDPALLEYYNNALFRVRIFPIQPHAEQRVKLTYTHSLPNESGTIEYALPFPNDKNKKTKIKEVSFKIDIESLDKIKSVFCPSHEVEINRKDDHHTTVGFEATNFSSTDPFKLYFSADNKKIGLSSLNFNNELEDGYFFMNISPGFAENQKIIAKDIVFVLDASGSMAGEKMEQAQKALSFCIANLNDEDRFNIVRFSTEASSMFENLELANDLNRKKAKAYINDLHAIGGTNIDEALELALKTNREKKRPYFVIFLTDGKPTLGETSEEALLKKVKTYNADNTRIFTFGIGTKLNTHLLDKLTEMTKAYRTYVLPEEDIEIKVSDFYTKVSSPILTNIKVKFDRTVSVSDVYPKDLPDLFKGSTLGLLGRYKGNGKGKITITGEVNGKQEEFTYAVNFDKKKEDYSFIPSLWATRTVGYLLDQIRLHGESKEVVAEVVRLAKKHGIITPYTSYLIIEDERISLRNQTIRQEDAFMSNRTANAPMENNKMETEYEYDMASDSGSGSIRASEEVQTMAESKNMAKSRPGSKRLDYKDKQGNTQNLADGIRNIQGRAVYQQGNQWLDTNLQLSSNQSLPINRVQFNSPDFFKLIDEEPEAIAFVSLGKNIRFVLNNQIWEVFE